MKRIGYLKELEDKYKLGYGIKTNDVQSLYSRVDFLLNMQDRNLVFQERRKLMLDDKIDYAQYLTWFVSNYPESRYIMQKTPNYQYNFK